jgi:hypothetical protein
VNITRLSDRRDARSAARAIHPAVWTPQDSIDTANDFHAWSDVAEYGTLDEPARPEAPWYVGQARARKAKWHNRAAVALLIAASVLLGAIFYAAAAKADTSDARAYAAEFGPAVCLTLDDFPSYGGFLGIAEAIERDGLSATEAGQAIGISVADICPRHTQLLTRIASMFGMRSVA